MREAAALCRGHLEGGAGHLAAAAIRMVRDVTTAAVRPEWAIRAAAHRVSDIAAQPLRVGEQFVEVPDDGREWTVGIGGIGHQNSIPCNQYSLITA